VGFRVVIRSMTRRFLWASALAIAATLLAGCSAESSASGVPEASVIPRAVFPHDDHVTRFGLKCRQCHHETDARVLQTPHPNYLSGNGVQCGTCHHSSSEPHRAQGCSNCHPVTPGDAADETLSAKVVIHETCWRCHQVARGAAASRTCSGCHAGRGGRAILPKAVMPVDGAR
jgi:hypothetical protein